MNGLYEVLQDEASWANAGGIEARHRWGLPGVKCPACEETWAQVGVAYPSVDLSNLPGEENYRQLWPVSLERLHELTRPVLGVVPDGTLPPPGTAFGPLIGRVHRRFGDFAWLDSWTLLARPEALGQLREAGVKLPKSVRAILTMKIKTDKELFELELEPRTKMDPSSFPSGLLVTCDLCGREQAKLPSDIAIQRSSIPNDVDIFRDTLFTTLILANGRFVEAVKRLELTGLEFREVDVT